jgi:hypothetical protein
MHMYERVAAVGAVQNDFNGSFKTEVIVYAYV